jgi:hypothetical protein
MWEIEGPKLGFIDHREHGVDVKEVLLDELVEDGSVWHNETPLSVEIVEVLRR